MSIFWCNSRKNKDVNKSIWYKRSRAIKYPVFSRTKLSFCLKYKKNKLRPFVRFSLSKDFNDVIAADLNGILILHMVDHATRCSWCSAVAVVKSKKKEEVDAYMRHWNPILETPGTILSDNVREFNNDLFHVLREQFNINVKAIPGESLLSNGIVKCHNAVLKKIVNKLMLDENIAWAVSAKNTLHTFL